MRVALLQCELEHRHQAPHLPMALMAADLEARGHAVRCGLLHPTRVGAAARALRGEVDWLVVDAIFPFDVLGRLRRESALPVLVGGHAAMQHALRGPADVSLVGPGRPALAIAIDCLASGTPWREVPGFWWREGGVLHCGPPAAPPDVAAAVLPFAPRVRWEYWGPPRAPDSDLRAPSVVIDQGCPWDRPILEDGGPFAHVEARLPDLAMVDEARERLEADWVRRDGGCSFCVFRYGRHRPGSRAAERLLRIQMQRWIAEGARGLSVQTEHPSPWLSRIFSMLDELDPRGRVEEVRTRTIPWLVLRHPTQWKEGIDLAARGGRRLVLSQVGFECFDEKGLRLFHKGCDVAENRAAARQLGQWTASSGGSFEGTWGHGLIPLHPWTTPDSLRQNLEALREDAPWLLPSLHPQSRLELYHEWSPLFWKAEDDGLLERSERGFGWGWRFADPRMDEVVAAWTMALRRQGGAAHEALGEVLDGLHPEPDPARRRREQPEMAAKGLSPEFRPRPSPSGES